jgi:hypothetical protein
VIPLTAVPAGCANVVAVPVVVILPTYGTLLSTNHRLPSDPATIPFGFAPAGEPAYSVIVGVDVAVGVGVGVALGFAVGVGEAVGFGVEVGVGDGVGVRKGVGEGVGEAVGPGVTGAPVAVNSPNTYCIPACKVSGSEPAGKVQVVTLPPMVTGPNSADQVPDGAPGDPVAFEGT